MAKKGFDIESLNMDDLLGDTEHDNDMDIEDLDQGVTPPTLNNSTHAKNKKPLNPLVVLFASTTILALAGCLFLLVENWSNYDQGIGASSSDVVTYTQEELDEYSSTLAANAADEATNEILTTIKTTMENENSVLTLFRNLYPEDIVIQADGKYNFIPIDDSFEKHNLVAENIVTEEDGSWSYYENGERVSHKGIDVSRFQGDIDWMKVAEDDVEFAFVRLGVRGYGNGKIVADANYAANMSGALNSGLDVGVYFYSQAITPEEALEEANFVIEQLGSYRINLPVVMDVEYVDGEGRADALTVEERTLIAQTFCDAIKEAGYDAMIYGNMRMLLLMLDMTQLRDYGSWFAYYNSPIYYPYKFDVWQYSESGSVDGINAVVDLNMIVGEYPW